jgi:hypothetical protein
VVTELSREYSFQTGIFRKSDMSFMERRLINKFPAVVMNNVVMSKGQDVTMEDIRWMVLRELSRSEHLP